MRFIPTELSIAPLTHESDGCWISAKHFDVADQKKEIKEEFLF